MRDDEDDNRMSRGWMMVFTIVWAIFFIWAIILAMKAPHSHRVVHLVLAIVFSPAYVLSYYLAGMHVSMGEMGFGGCGCGK